MKDITPEEFRCVPASCPAVLISDDGKELLIIGTVANRALNPELDGRIGGEEEAVTISIDVVRKALSAASESA